jgi:hypothetical protein
MPYDQSTFGSLLNGVEGVGFPRRGGRLGGGMPGLMPASVITHDNDSSFELTRDVLRRVWAKAPVGVAKGSCTPFRAKMNAGDFYTRLNYSCGGPCQAPQSVPGLHAIKPRIGVIQRLCDETNVPPSACNVRYVYDSSDYITFRKNQAVNRNYNDLSFGGDRYNASQSNLSMIRRF